MCGRQFRVESDGLRKGEFLGLLLRDLQPDVRQCPAALYVKRPKAAVALEGHSGGRLPAPDERSGMR